MINQNYEDKLNFSYYAENNTLINVLEALQFVIYDQGIQSCSFN